MSIKRPLLLSIALCLGLLFLSPDGYGGQNTEPSATSGEPKAAAKAVAVEPVFEFEPVLDGETVTHKFVIKNTGTAELKILKVRTG